MAALPTVFVTSATGSQGKALCLQLRDLGWNVRATTRDPNSLSAQALHSAGVHLTVGSWDNQDGLRKGLEGCDKLFLCLLPNLADFDQAPRRAELITRLAKQAGVRHAIASTTLGCFLLEEGHIPPVKLGPFFEAHCRSKQRVEQAIIDGGFEYWTILRPSFFMANFVEPKIQFGYTDVKKGSWKSSLLPDTELGLVDHIDIARLAAAGFQKPEFYHRKKMAVVSQDLLVQDAMNQIAGAVGDGRSIEAVFMTDQEIAEEQAKGSWLFFASEPCLRYISGIADVRALDQLIPGLTTFKQFLEREKAAVAETYKS
jgi:uncharacterized protein YbjT (DUF2867 family)